jgi:hypothetical protein
MQEVSGQIFEPLERIGKPIRGRNYQARFVKAISTMFAQDEQGVIRFENIRGEALEKSVNALLTEAKNTPARSR